MINTINIINVNWSNGLINELLTEIGWGVEKIENWKKLKKLKNWKKLKKNWKKIEKKLKKNWKNESM